MELIIVNKMFVLTDPLIKIIFNFLSSQNALIFNKYFTGDKQLGSFINSMFGLFVLGQNSGLFLMENNQIVGSN